MKSIQHILLFSLLLLFTPIVTLANDALQEKAEKAYANKNYKEAISIYESFIKEGLISYKLYYNLGNAYYKNNQLGKAIYNYEMANKLQPNSKDIKNNLKIANEKTIDKIESKENFFIVAIKSGLVNSLSTNGWAWFSVFSLTAAFAFGFIFFISNKLIFKRIGFVLGGISFIVFISSMILGYIAIEDKQELSFAIVINRETKIFEEPNSVSKSKFSLHEGTKINVLETNTDWTNIKLENGNEGWVKTTDLGLF